MAITQQKQLQGLTSESLTKELVAGTYQLNQKEQIIGALPTETLQILLMWRKPADIRHQLCRLLSKLLNT